MNSFEELNAKINRLKREGGVGWIEPCKFVLSFALVDGTAITEATSDKLEVGKTYTIHTDSGVYTAECKSSTTAGATIKFIGNAGLILPGLMTDNGLPYCACYVDNTNPQLGAVGKSYGAADKNGGKVLTVKTPETIHPISDKYLPGGGGGGGGLPVVELTTPLPPDAGEDAILSAEETAAFASAAKMGSPVVCTFPTEMNGDHVVVSMVLNKMNLDGDSIFIGEIRPILFSASSYALVVFPGDNYTAGFVDTAFFGNPMTRR